MVKIRTLTLVFFLVAGMAAFALQHQAYATSCDAIVGKWSWFTGGVVTINPNGTMVHEPGNDGTWECTDASRGVFTLRWRIGGYMNSLALSVDGQGLSSTDQSQYYVTARRITTDKKGDDKDALAQNPSGYIPSLNAKVTSLRFFESGYNAPPREQRVYSNRFDKSETRYVNWELNLEFPAPGNRRSYVVEQFWYSPDGDLLTRQQTNSISIEPNWTWSYYSHSYGWQNSDNWSEGSYRVDLYVEEQKVASGSFEIYGASSSRKYVSKGLEYYKTGKLDEAIAEYNKAIDLNPRDSDAYLNRGVAYHDKELYDQAIYDYGKVIELKPQDAMAYSNRCESYRKKKIYDQAISDCSKAINIKPDYAKAFNNRGAAYDGKRLHDQAVSDYSKAIELDPKYPEPYRNRCSVYIDKKRFKEAITDCTKAVELKPDYRNAYYDRSLAYHDLKEYKKSLSDLNKVIELNPNDAEAYNQRADVHDHLDDLGNAIKDLKKAKELGYKIDEGYLEDLEFFNEF